MESSTAVGQPGQETKMLRLADAKDLLTQPYMVVEAGVGLTEDNMLHVAASTYMPGCSAEMIDWWFGFIHTTEQYRWWHPRDHVFSDFEGPRNNDSTYIGGSHLVKEYIGDNFESLIISFKDPAIYFGKTWKEDFAKHGYGTAICGRVGSWNSETNERKYNAHLIHLIKNEPDACRMRSRFWLGDIEGLDKAVGDKIPVSHGTGLLRHATEEMAILASKLPSLYKQYSRPKTQL